jgi:hypothetical protein
MVEEKETNYIICMRRKTRWDVGVSNTPYSEYKLLESAKSFHIFNDILQYTVNASEEKIRVALNKIFTKQEYNEKFYMFCTKKIPIHVSSKVDRRISAEVTYNFPPGVRYFQFVIESTLNHILKKQFVCDYFAPPIDPDLKIVIDMISEQQSS